MGRTSNYKAISVSPLIGPLDNRSDPDNMNFGTYRTRQNFATTAQKKLCRRYGWEKLLSKEDYNNQDLHDQNLTVLQDCGVLNDHVRQSITYLSEVSSSTGSRRLLAGTQRRIYTLDYGIGNWRIIADSLGGNTQEEPCPSRRWYSATSGDYTLFTNGYDPVSYWIYDTQPADCNSDAVQPVPELLTLGITSANVIYAWRSVIFIADIVQDSERFESRVMWGDFSDPLSWSPDPGVSIAGFQDLDDNDRVLAFRELGDYLIVYCAKSIWQISVVTTDEVLNFRKVYSESKGSEACLKYRNTLVSTGGFHYYFGSDGIYSYSLFYPKPQLIDWLHLATADIFEDINEELCDVHVGEINPETKEIWFSWAQAEATCPSKTMVLNYEYSVVDFVDHGFTAFVNFTPDTRPDLHSFLLDNCVCSVEELETLLNAFLKAGTFCADPIEPDCSDPPTSIYSNTPLVVNGNTTEDYTQPNPDPDSLCARLGDQTLEEICHECLENQLFVMASTTDYCLKQYGGVYYRERCTDFTGCGVYTLDGYDSILRSGPMPFGLPDRWKEIDEFEVQFEAIPQTVPNNLMLRFGYAEQALDPNELAGACQIIWRTQPAKPFACANTRLPAEYLADNLKPGLGAYWPMFYEGKYFYWELKLSGTGGGGCLSRVTMNIRPLSKCDP